MPTPRITASDPFAVRHRQLFVDTSAYYATIDHDDASHIAATATMGRLVRANRSLTTTNVVLIELHGLLLGRLGRRIALRALLEPRAS